MAVIRCLSDSDPVQYLVLEKFPALSWFSHRNIKKDFQMDVEERKELLESSEAYRRELLALPRLELIALVSSTKLAEERRIAEAKQAEELRRFYNQPEATADWSRWASAAYWTLDEATALSFGKDPRIVRWEKLAPYVNIWPFAKDFADRRDLIVRAKFMGQLWDQTIPSIVLAWAGRARFPMPPELIAEVESLGIQIADWKTLFDDQKAITARKMKEIADLERVVGTLNLRVQTLASAADGPPTKQLGTRERESLLKMIIGMAINGYGHDPKASRSSTAKEVASDLALQGLPLDEDTVRKYLVEARELLPGGETE